MHGYMRVTATKLRENLYAILDQALETGGIVEVLRKGKILKIVPEKTGSKLARLKRHATFTGNPDDFVHMDWLKEQSELR